MLDLLLPGFAMQAFDHFHNKIFVIKIGSTALSLPDGRLNETLLQNLIAELALAKSHGAFVVFVTSGAVNLGRTLYGDTPVSGKSKQISAGIGQAALMYVYQGLLARHGLFACQLLFDQHHIAASLQNLRAMLGDLRSCPAVLPIINENDVVADKSKRTVFADNDELAEKLAVLVQADRLIILSHTDGIYDSDGSVITHIDPTTDIDVAVDICRRAGCTKSAAGRGGVVTKLQASMRAAAAGITTHIADAREVNILTRLSEGEAIGTTIALRPRYRQTPHVEKATFK